MDSPRRYQDARKAIDRALHDAGLTGQLEAAVQAVLPMVDPAALEEWDRVDRPTGH